TQFGILVGAYGLAMVFGQAVLGRLSDRVGRKPVIAAGMLLTMLFYLGLATQDQFVPMVATALLAGLGIALATPALSAFYLDITAAAHRSRVMGLKESAAALGGVAGPLAVALFSRWLPPQTIFIIAAVLMAAGAALVVALLKEQRRSRTATQAAAPPVGAGTMPEPTA
ncbi:MAG TPA: MFS transporter, partial [Chloroflexia bacterium]